jgi:hypothetical protein
VPQEIAGRWKKQEQAAGWPDEFVKKIAQNVAQYILVKINA